MDPMDIDSIVDGPDTPDRPATRNTKGKSRLNGDCSDKARMAVSAFENCSRKVSLQAPGSLRSSVSGHGSSTSPAQRNSFAFRGLVDDIFPTYANTDIQSAKSNAMQNTISDVYQDGPAEDLTGGYTNKGKKPVSWGSSGGIKAVENVGNLLSTVQLHSEQSVANPLVASGINEGNGSVDGVLSLNHRGKGVESYAIPQPQTRNTNVSPNSTSPSRVAGQKRLVHIGCKSPCNISKTQQIVCEDKNGKVDDNGICQTLPVSSSGQAGVSARMPLADAQASHVSKGKGTLPLPMKDPGSQNANNRDTVNIINEIVEEVDDINERFRNFGDLSGWRSTCKEHPLLPVDHSSSIPPMRQQLNLLRSERNHNNGDHPLTDMIRDDYSRRNLDDSGIVVLGSSRHTNESIPTRSRRHYRVGTVERVIETDEGRIRSNGLNGASSTSRQDAMGRQVKADEILARELQLQLYNEDLGDRLGEIHAPEALDLQDENTQHVSSRRRHEFSDRCVLAANSTTSSHVRHATNIPRTSSQALASIHSRVDRYRNRIPGRPGPLSSSSRSSSVFPARMDVDMRMSIVEALEAFNRTHVDNSFLEINHEFNENVNHFLRHSGASICQINCLPQSTVQNDNGEEACVVCLETPTTGDVIRHLPCLHKFHKDCIDPWLMRKGSCPICKSSITRSS